MKKFAAMIFLITLISLSAALPNALNNQVGQVGFNSGAAKLNPIVDSSSSANTVNIKSFSFQPATLNVPAGTTVTWHNQDNVQHTVTSDVQGLFDSGTINTGKKFTYTFQAPGSYSYHCSIHPGMKGTIVVTGTGQQATQSILPGKLLSSSAIQGINPGSAQENSGNGGSPSWSEKPLSGQTTSRECGNRGRPAEQEPGANTRYAARPECGAVGAVVDAEQSRGFQPAFHSRTRSSSSPSIIVLHPRFPRTNSPRLPRSI